MAYKFWMRYKHFLRELHCCEDVIYFITRVPALIQEQRNYRLSQYMGIISVQISNCKNLYRRAGVSVQCVHSFRKHKHFVAAGSHSCAFATFHRPF